MRVLFAYIGGVLVGTAIAYEAPKELLHNPYVHFVGLVIAFLAIIWPKRGR